MDNKQKRKRGDEKEKGQEIPKAFSDEDFSFLRTCHIDEDLDEIECGAEDVFQQF